MIEGVPRFSCRFPPLPDHERAPLPRFPPQRTRTQNRLRRRGCASRWASLRQGLTASVSFHRFRFHRSRRSWASSDWARASTFGGRRLVHLVGDLGQLNLGVLEPVVQRGPLGVHLAVQLDQGTNLSGRLDRNFLGQSSMCQGAKPVFARLAQRSGARAEGTPAVALSSKAALALLAKSPTAWHHELGL